MQNRFGFDLDGLAKASSISRRGTSPPASVSKQRPQKRAKPNGPADDNAQSFSTAERSVCCSGRTLNPKVVQAASIL